MNCNVLRFVAFDEVLRLVSRGVVDIAFEPYVGNNFLQNDATNSPRFRVPFNVVAAFESLGRHSGDHFDSATRLDSRGKADSQQTFRIVSRQTGMTRIENPVGTD